MCSSTPSCVSNRNDYLSFDFIYTNFKNMKLSPSVVQIRIVVNPEQELVTGKGTWEGNLEGLVVLCFLISVLVTRVFIS